MPSEFGGVPYHTISQVHGKDSRMKGGCVGQPFSRYNEASECIKPAAPGTV